MNNLIPNAVPNAVGRPRRTPSDKRFNAATDALNRILKREKETAVVLLRACELLLLIHGKTLPGGLDKRDKRAISALVCESNMERTLNQQIDAQIEADHVQAQQQAEEAAQEITRQVYSAILD